MCASINRREYYSVLVRQRYRLLRKLEHLITKLYVAGADKETLDRLARIYRRVETSAIQFALLEALP